jgi:hypothetical protein
VAYPVERLADGHIRLTLRAGDATIIEAFVRDLAETLASDNLESETRARMFPRAYLDPTEEAAEQVWQSVVHDDLLTGRVAALRTMHNDITSARESDGNLVIDLDEPRETEWLMALNDARLVIGTALDVSEDSDLNVPPDDPRYALVALYQWFNALQADLVDVMLEALPETGIE